VTGFCAFSSLPEGVPLLALETLLGTGRRTTLALAGRLAGGLAGGLASFGERALTALLTRDPLRDFFAAGLLGDRLAARRCFGMQVLGRPPSAQDSNKRPGAGQAT
jgi:hypothetical protein